MRVSLFTYPLSLVNSYKNYVDIVDMNGTWVATLQNWNEAAHFVKIINRDAEIRKGKE